MYSELPDIVCADEIVSYVSTVSLSKFYKASEVDLSNCPRSYWQSSQVVSPLASSSLIFSFCSPCCAFINPPCCAFNARSVCPKSLSGAMTLRTRDLRALTSIERTQLAVYLQSRASKPWCPLHSPRIPRCVSRRASDQANLEMKHTRKPPISLPIPQNTLLC